MSGSVTPARRSRSEYEDEVEEEDEISVDGEEPQSSARKRTRIDEDEEGSDEDEDYGQADGDDEDAASQERPLLPDSYRRSPKGKGAAGSSRPHQPGSIVRVRLKDFVTYTNAEFNLGPNLNMIIGPNGTGKSTLVCAICLGLGWETKHLGRAKDISEFVKHGSKLATIEVELARDPSRQRTNPIITTKISREGNKVEYLIDGKKENKKRVIEFARSFSIQVDNLCQFLPQDKVVEFAALSPVDLLAQTQRAAAPEYMTEWHQQLKEMRKEQRTKVSEQKAKTERLASLENRQRMQQADVDRLRERTELQQRLTLLERFRPFPEYALAKEKHLEAKAERKTAEKEFKRLERLMEPNLQAVAAKESYHTSIEKSVKTKQRVRDRAEALCNTKNEEFEKAQEELEGIANEIQVERNSRKQYSQKMPEHHRTVTELKKAMETPPEQIDTAAYNERIRALSREIREHDNENNLIKEELRRLNEQRQQQKAIINEAEAEKDHLQSQAGQQEKKLANVSRDAARAWSWIQNNRDQFQGSVFGPPLLECTVKDMRQAAAVEYALRNELTAFTVTNKNDFTMLGNQLYGEMHLTDINIRQAPTRSLESYQPPVSKQQLSAYGMQCYVLDLIDGPEEVLAMLCDNRSIESIAYAPTDGGSEQFQQLQRSPINSWVTNTQFSIITRRREYGDKATSTRVNDIPAARCFTDTPVDRQVEQQIQGRINDASRDIETIEDQARELNEKYKAHNADIKTLNASKAEVSKEKDEKQRAYSTFQGLPARLQGAEQKRDEAQQKIDQFQHRCQEIASKGDKLALQKAQYALDCAGVIEALRVQHVELFKLEIMKIEAKSDLEQLQARHQEESNQLAAAELRVRELSKVEKALLEKGRELTAICQEIGVDDLDDAEHQVFEEVKVMKPDQLDTEVQSTQARLEMTTGGGNANTIAEYEQRGRKIEQEREVLEGLKNELEQLEGSIGEVKTRWEPDLDALVSKISEAFAENFAQIQCAGEVGVHKDEEFAEWAIQIKVKFRESEPLSILDSHRQSGGERAVSTIFYLMALQSLARAPFRVVDEINQGMDPRNERLVHSRMVGIACASAREGGGGGSQYFLITPKLLSGLEYHPNMKVHCIASGEYMPEDNAGMDFRELAKKALALKAAARAR